MKHFREEPKPKKKAGKVIVTILLLVFIAGFGIGGFMTLRTYLNAKHEAETFDELAALVDEGENDSGEKYNKDTGTLRKYDELYKRNPDFYGWLKIEGTNINYPVMYTPGDSERYLHLDFYGNYSDSGSLFMDGDCPSDGSTALIYGHHMNNGSMFGSLPDYGDYDFYKKHKTIFFDTRYEQRDYEVVAVFYSEIYPESEEPYHYCYYHHKNLSNEDEFNEYISYAKANSLYDTGVTPKYGEQILTLSTCNYHTKNGRFVLVARRTDKTNNE